MDYKDLVVIGGGATILYGATIGRSATIGPNATIGRCVTIGDNVVIGANATIEDNVVIGANATIGYFATIGNSVTIEYGAKIDSHATIGANATIEDGVTIGNSVTIDRRLTWCGLKIRAWMCLSNVDGFGRQVKVLIHTDGIAIEAGCFFGSLDEFCAKSDGKGKHRYSVVVRAAAEALLADANERGETGGWEVGD